jgi:hypothetical protein
VKAESAFALFKGRPSGRPLHFYGKRRNGRKSLAPMLRTCPRRQIGNLNVHSESVRGAPEARLASCRVLSHDAAGFVCRRACRAASSGFWRAGADRCDAPRRRDLPGAVSQFGEPRRIPRLCRAACADPGKPGRPSTNESASRDGHINAAGQSSDPISPNSRARKSFHAPGVAAANGGN